MPSGGQICESITAI